MPKMSRTAEASSIAPIVEKKIGMDRPSCAHIFARNGRPSESASSHQPMSITPASSLERCTGESAVDAGNSAARTMCQQQKTLAANLVNLEDRSEVDLRVREFFDCVCEHRQ
jgi:hypothetical protein